MKAIKQSMVLLFSVLVLGACGETANTEVEEAAADTTENWPVHIREGNEALESYSSDTQLNLVMEMGEGVVADEDEAFIHMQVIGDLEQGYTKDDVNTLYFEGQDVYAHEGNTWVHYPDSGPIEYPSWYPNIISSLVEIEDFIEPTHADGNIKLFYEGNDPEVWDAFEEEFALSIDGVSQENITITLEAIFDDADYYLQTLRMDILGEESDQEIQLGKINILIDVDYFDHNNVDLSDIEEEVFEDNAL